MKQKARAAAEATRKGVASVGILGFVALALNGIAACQAVLVRDGVPPNAITVQGYGGSRQLAPTAQVVREPQNRRVEIVLR